MSAVRLSRAAVLALFAASPVLSSCVVALPTVAAGVIAKKQVNRKNARSRAGRAQQTEILPLTELPAPSSAPAPVPAGPAAGMQYLYGSGEAAALSIQAYQALWNYVYARVLDRRMGREVAAVVLSSEATLVVPKFMPCGKKPLAIVLDVDETAVLNLGYEAADAQRTGSYDEARWSRWEATGADKVAAVPGAVETLDAARRAGVVIVFNSNRSVTNAPATIAALKGAGLGDAELGKTLWLRESGAPSGKDSRRWEIAAKYCVVALVGDQLGDFSDLFNPGGVPVAIRRNLATQTMMAPMWGTGWFVLPNPVYGTGLHGGVDDIFPQDKRWTDPGEAPAPAPATPTP